MKPIARGAALAAGFFMIAATAAAQTPKPVRPDSVGMDAARLARLETAMADFAAKGGRAGISWIVAREGKIVSHGATGFQNLETRTPMRPETIVRVYSMTKHVTAIAAMILVEEGKIQLNDPVAKYIPAFADVQVFKGLDGAGKPILSPPKNTLRLIHLLTHTSGIQTALSYPKEVGFEREKLLGLGLTIGQGVDYLATRPLMFEPGEGLRYSYGLDVMGRVIEIASGMRFDQFLKTRLFDPLKMNDTGFFVPAEKRARFSEVYARGEGGALLNATARAPKSSDYLNPEGIMFSGGGGLVSTAYDFFRFYQMLVEGGELDGARILSPTSVAFALARRVPETLPTVEVIMGGAGPPDPSFLGYDQALGAGVRGARAATHGVGSEGEFTWGGLAGTFMFGDPKEKLVGILMTQFVGSNWATDDDVTLPSRFRALSYQAIVEPNENRED